MDAACTGGLDFAANEHELRFCACRNTAYDKSWFTNFLNAAVLWHCWVFVQVLIPISRSTLLHV